jgi:hypothetical protein
MNGRWEIRGTAFVVCLNILFGICPEDLMEMKIKLKDIWLLQEF